MYLGSSSDAYETGRRAFSAACVVRVEARTKVLSTAFSTSDQKVKFTGDLPSTQRNGWKNSFFVIANQKMEAEHHKLVSRMKACADGGTSLRTES